MRCPYERAFSSYLQLNNPKFLRLAQNDVFTPGMKVRESVLKATTGHEVGIEHPISFLQYLIWLQSQDFRKLDPHHTPQMTPLEELIPVRWYRLEDFSLATKKLEKEFSLKSSSPISGRFSSGHHQLKEQIDPLDVLAFLEQPMYCDTALTRKVPVVTRSLLEGTKFDELIRESFSKDIARYDSINS